MIMVDDVYRQGSTQTFFNGVENNLLACSMKSSMNHQFTRGVKWKRLNQAKVLPSKMDGYDGHSIRAFLMGEPGSGAPGIADGFRKIYGFSRDRQIDMDESAIDFLAYKRHAICIALDEMISLVNKVEAIGVVYANYDRSTDAGKVVYYKPRSAKTEVPNSIWSALGRLWEDIEFQRCVRRICPSDTEFEEIQHYFGSIERMSTSKYIPTMNDVAHCQKKLNGISETPLRKKLWLIEVAPIRTATHFKRVIQFFITSTIVVYCVDISKFDQVDENGKNLLLKSHELFKTLSTDKYMREVPIFVFFTNKENFERKLKQSSIRVCFPGYRGTNSVDESYQYVRKFFGDLVGKYFYFSLLVSSTFPNEEDKKTVKGAMYKIAAEMQTGTGTSDFSRYW